MKRLFGTLVLSLLAMGAFAQDAVETSTKPTTKLEAFSVRTGIVLIKGFTTLGTIEGMNRMTIDVREFRDASNPKSAQYGVSIEVREISRLERTNTSYIDEDEIDSLIKGLDYITRIDRTVTSLGNFEATYKTRGDFSVTVFSEAGGSVGLAVSSGRIGRTTAYFKLTDVEKMKAQLNEAKRLIASAKTART